MARLPQVGRDELNVEDQSAYDEIVKSRGQVRGPFTMLIHSPQLCARVAATGEYLRFNSALSPALREVATLAVAREVNSQFVFTAHARLARQANVTETTIDALKRGNTPEGISSDEALVMKFVRELLRDRKVTDATFAAARERFDAQGTVDLTGIIGHYLSVIQVINAFEIELSPDVAPELPA